MDADDARYERPCRLLLAVAAGIHWVAAALVIHERLAEIPSGVEHTQVLATLLRAIGLA